MHEVKARDGSRVTISQEAIDHIERKHPQMLARVGLRGEEWVSSVILTLEKPNAVYVDASRSKYFLRKIDGLYFNVIVSADNVKTAYLIGVQTYRRMEKTRWLHRLF